MQMALALGNGQEDSFVYEGSHGSWSRDCHDMRLPQSHTIPQNNLLFRPKRDCHIVLDVYATVIPRSTWVKDVTIHRSVVV